MKWFCLSVVLILIISCNDDGIVEPLYFFDLMETPNGFPAIETPEGNEFTAARWELGKKLFYDQIMSVDSSISCASCHQPSLAFSDNVSMSLGVEQRLGTRNSPSLANVAYHPYFTREGGVPTLEMQILVPIQEHNEFDFNILLIAERLERNAEYVAMAAEAYNRTPDAFVITRALANFERTLISGYSPYDQYKNYNKTNALTAAEIRGMNLFFSNKTKCSTCHGGFNFTNYAFENNGLYEVYPDVGRFRLTNNPADSALFKVSSLRNIELTAPYMHDGSLFTLEEVVNHYQTGGKNHRRKSNLIQPLNLTETEKQDLVSFLKSLTDESFVNNPLFKR
jgi:cytochrome c peroxidase